MEILSKLTSPCMRVAGGTSHVPSAGEVGSSSRRREMDARPQILPFALLGLSPPSSTLVCAPGRWTDEPVTGPQRSLASSRVQPVRTPVGEGWRGQ